MRFPHPRFTVRRMMVVVVIVAMLLGSYLMIRRSREFQLMAVKREVTCQLRMIQFNNYKLMEKADESQLNTAKAGFSSNSWFLQRALVHLKETRTEIESFQKKVDYWNSLQKKYDWASKHPWLAVEPDPPEPN